MPTKELSIKYRPVRIGFVVRDGSVEDLVKAAGVNTLLFGGIYNPIIPISEKNDFSEQLIKVFNVDILYAVEADDHIKKFMLNYEYDQNPFFVSQSIFYEEWQTKKKLPVYLDSLNLIFRAYEKNFKDKPKGFHSDYTFPIWDKTHPLSNLFSIWFGFYPSGYELKDDFESWFNSGLQPHAFNLNSKSKDNPTEFEVNAGIYNRITPLTLTKTELAGHGGRLRDGGIGVFVGNENDFGDLSLFWNLRAGGTQVEFLPLNYFKNFETYIGLHISQADRILSDPLERMDFISAYCRYANYEVVKTAIKDLSSNHKILTLPCDDDVRWNGYNFEIINPYFLKQTSLASIDKPSDKYVVTFGLPDINLSENYRPEIENQGFVTSIEIPEEQFSFPEQTLNVPPIRQLNPFYGGRMVSNPFYVKVEDRGLRILVRPKDHSLAISPIPYSQIVKKIFEVAGIAAGPSQPGIITQQIIQKLNGLAGGQFFKISGVRKLLKSLSKDESITRGQATKMIHDENFEKFENLFLSRKLTPTEVFDWLLKKEFFRAGLDLVCGSCNLHNWISLREINDIWTCDYCGNQSLTSLHLKNRGDWRFRKSGLFAKDNNQEGAIPVILTLIQLHPPLSPGHIYSPALNLKFDGVKCETDFCIVTHNSNMQIRIGLSECKSDGGVISAEDVTNLKAAAIRLNQLGMETFLIFSKTSEEFSTDEIALFKGLKEDHISCILFTRSDLERFLLSPDTEYEPFIKHPFSFTELSINSDKRYLDE